MNALLDINIVLDVFLNRDEFLPESAAIFFANHENRLIGHLSAASLPTIFYIVRRNVGYERAKVVVIECLSSFTILLSDGSMATVERMKNGKREMRNEHAPKALCRVPYRFTANGA
jgi:hypothetical protein